MGLRRASHVAWRRVGDETVVIHLKTKRIYVLNSSGGYFWHNLDGTRGRDEILDRLELDAPLPETAANELDGFLEKLVEANLVDTNESPGPDTSSDANKYPLPHFVPPELVWQEQLRNFGQSCQTNPGEMAACDAVPTF